MDRGPVDERGAYDPQKATLSYPEAVRKGWVKKPEKCPPFWRPALEKALELEINRLKARAEREREGLEDPRAQELEKARRMQREERLRQLFPGWK